MEALKVLSALVIGALTFGMGLISLVEGNFTIAVWTLGVCALTSWYVIHKATSDIN